MTKKFTGPGPKHDAWRIICKVISGTLKTVLGYSFARALESPDIKVGTLTHSIRKHRTDSITYYLGIHQVPADETKAMGVHTI